MAINPVDDLLSAYRITAAAPGPSAARAAPPIRLDLRSEPDQRLRDPNKGNIIDIRA